MKTNTTFLWSLVVALLVGGLIGYYASPDRSLTTGTIGENGIPVTTIKQGESADKQIALHGAMRKLWADHVFWTREYMIAALADSASAGADASRLMKNQEDIGNAFAGYYGADNATKLTTMLKEHITIAVELVAAAKANDQEKFTDANTRWESNADQIATFLSEANPNWSKAAAAELMTMHLQTTSAELTALLNKEHEKGITEFDAVFTHMMGMSDVLSVGIIKQFPEKF